jgi:glycosyltransferase involved in cell wall biosynthesis
VAYVAISDADRHPDLTYAATIHHGIRTDDFPFDADGSDDLLFFGRIHPDKGPAEAIRAASAAGSRLVMAGLIQDQVYYAEHVRPFIDGDRVRFLGVVGGADRLTTLGRARALLHLIAFDEPFGLSVVEALACGTPVIAYRRGSMAELIDDGVTGFLVDTLDEAVAAIDKIDTIDRGACRRVAAERFSVDRMADAYLALYHSVIAR